MSNNTKEKILEAAESLFYKYALGDVYVEKELYQKMKNLNTKTSHTV